MNILMMDLYHPRIGFNMKSIHPRLGAGIFTIAILLISLLVEIFFAFPLLSDYIIYVGIFTITFGIIICIVLASKYDPEDNDNPKMYAIYFSLATLFLILAWLHFR